MDNGYVKLWRKSINSRVFRNDGLWKVWTWCLMKASHKERWVDMKTGKSIIEIKITPGQFVYGRLSAAKELNMKPSTVRNRMKKLQNMLNLDIKEDSQYSIVSIINWGPYQPMEIKKDNKEDNQRTIKGQSKDTDKNVKNEYSDKLKTFVGNYINYILEAYPTKSPSQKNIKSNSLETIEKLIRIDGFEEEYIFNALRWSRDDEFWRTQLFSLASLRKKSGNGLTKFQNLSNAFDKDKPEQAKPKIPVFRVVNDD